MRPLALVLLSAFAACSLGSRSDAGSALAPGQPRAAELPPRPTKRFLWMSDSIYNRPAIWSQTVLGTGWNDDSEHATYSGTVSGTALLELSDEVWAFEGGAWVEKQRGRPWADYDGVIFEYGANDAGSSASAFRRSMDTIISRAKAVVPTVVAGGPPPRALPDLSGWDSSNDPYLWNGHRTAADELRSKWNVTYTDTFSLFSRLVEAKTYTVADLMRDRVHVSEGIGTTEVGSEIARNLLHELVLTDAKPEIAGRIVTHLWGEPISGAWTITATPHGGGLSSPLFRIAGLPDQANVSNDASARLSFPPVPEGTQQVWLHYLSSKSGGYLYPTWDRNRPGSFFLARGTQSDMLTNYTGSVLLIDAPAPGAHTLDVDAVCTAGPCRVLGVTYVGVP